MSEPGQRPGGHWPTGLASAAGGRTGSGGRRLDGAGRLRRPIRGDAQVMRDARLTKRLRRLYS